MHAEEPYDRGRPPTYEASSLPGRTQPAPPIQYRQLPLPMANPTPQQHQQSYTASPQHERHPDLPPPPPQYGHQSPNNHVGGGAAAASGGSGGGLVNYSPRYKQEPHATSSPSSASQPSPAQDAYSSGTHPGGGPFENHHRNSVDDGRHDGYHSQDQHPIPGSIHHGIPHHIQTDYSSSGFVPLQHSASAPSYEPAYPYGHPAGMHGAQYRKKAARAAQACDQCRKKKAKCDENRPSCGNCSSQGLECKYADVPPPKQDRTLIQMGDQLHQYSSLLGGLIRGFEDFQKEFREGMRVIHEERNRPSVMSPPLQTPVKNQNYPSMQMQIKSQDREGLYNYPPQFSSQPSRRETPELEQHRHGSAFAKQSGVTSQKQTIEMDRLEQLDTLNGEATIPPEHATGAHKLYLWSRIKLFYENITDAEYVQREALKRGPLLQINSKRVIHGTPKIKESPAARSDYDDKMSPSNESGRFYSSHYQNHLSTAGIKENHPTPQDSLESLPDSETGRRLLASYLDNIHIMHPMLHERTITDLVEQFTLTNSMSQAQMPSGGYSTQWDYSSPSWDNEAPNAKSQKRKRSQFVENQEDLRRGGGPTAPPPLEATLENALVCLVFALGAICEHKSSLAPLFNPLEISNTHPSTSHGPALTSSTSLQQQLFQNSPQYQSPASSPATPQSGSKPPSAAVAHDGIVGSKRPSSRTSWSSGGNNAAGVIHRYEPRDLDAIPGMAYYRKAASILGELRGGNELQDIQACLLAGVYLAQLIRVRESWDWIHEACKKCGLLLKRLDFEKTRVQPEDAVRMVYWTCVQFESDILAELDFLPNSGLSRFSEQIKLPQGEDCAREARASERTMLFYSAQASLRKILDRIHSALYNSQAGRAENRNVGWSSMDADGLLEQLQTWKTALPDLLKWDEELGTPARDINTARLRAKYYGARYVALRPFLQQYIHDEGTKKGMKPVNDTGDTGFPTVDFGSTPHEQQSGTPGSNKGNDSQRDARSFMQQSNECAKAAKSSTVAFDQVETMPSRLIVTNIWGTAHAQFGNMLVLAAGRMCPDTTWMCPDSEFDSLMDRTITFFRNLAPLSPTMHTDLMVLENAKRIVNVYRSNNNSASQSFTN